MDGIVICAKKDLDQHQKELVVNNYSFKYNPTLRLLGIILDEKIKFDNHIMPVERKANNSIHIIRELMFILHFLVNSTIVSMSSVAFFLISLDLVLCVIKCHRLQTCSCLL
jgi:hypothetical protein